MKIITDWLEDKISERRIVLDFIEDEIELSMLAGALLAEAEADGYSAVQLRAACGGDVSAYIGGMRRSSAGIAAAA